MLRNLTAALVATALLAGPAFAAQASGDSATVPAAAATKVQPTAKPMQAQKPTNPANPAKATKTVKTLKHGRAHVRHHTAHVVKPGKATKSTKSAA